MRYRAQASRPEHFYWLKSRTGCALEDGFRAIEVTDPHDVDWCSLCQNWHARIKGMTGFTGWTVNSVSIHVAMETPLALRMLAPASFHYAFREANKRFLVGLTAGDNEKALRLNRLLGFKEVYRHKDGWSDGIDMVLQELRREEWEKDPRAWIRTWMKEK